MKYFPLKVAIFCLLLTPVLYITTITFSQKYFDNYYFQKIEKIFIGDTLKLLNGKITVEKQIADNIHTFLKNSKTIKYFDLELKILITTSGNKVIYPDLSNNNNNNDVLVNELFKNSNFDSIAKHNFTILNNGLQINSVKINLNHGTRAANIIFIVYFCITILIFTCFYNSGSVRAKRDAKKKKFLIDSLQKEEVLHKQNLENMKKERQGLFKSIKSLNARYQKEKKKLQINEDELLDEMVSLEEQLNSYIQSKQKKEEEIEELKLKIRKFERRKSSKNRRNEFDFMFKRFAALYKNLQMNRKAVSGFLDLGDDQQIKAEECIFLLNQDQKTVTIKRKVFTGKKHKTACFEVLFAYTGRLYFRKNQSNKREIVTIGTKNSQAKDMDFLHSL